jgi:hypothetical protein
MVANPVRQRIIGQLTLASSSSIQVRASPRVLIDTDARVGEIALAGAAVMVGCSMSHN